MASIEQGQSNTIERSSSFKRRQNTALASGIAYLIPSAFALFIGIRILASGEGEQVFAAIFCIAVAMWLISMACGVLWCDVCTRVHKLCTYIYSHFYNRLKIWEDR